MCQLLSLSLGLSTERLLRAQTLVTRLFPDEAYASREAVGRRAQMGSEMLYRSGAVPIDGALTYGEYDLEHFYDLVSRTGDLEGATLLDDGSGCGRLVVAASALWPELRCAIGVEKIEELHEVGVRAVRGLADEERGRAVLHCGDATGLREVMRAADVVFAYSSAFPSDGVLLTDFSATCGTRLREGTRVITTDKRLASDDATPWCFELIEAVEGPNRETGGSSVGYVQRVVRSTLGAWT